jgi:hypothetical protein
MPFYRRTCARSERNRSWISNIFRLYSELAYRSIGRYSSVQILVSLHFHVVF